MSCDSRQRPFRPMRKPELLAAVDRYWNDGRMLHALLQELKCRRPRRWKAVQVSRISARLIELGEQSFVWPSTEAVPGRRHAFSGNMHHSGMLSYVGYKVGHQGLPPSSRRDLLGAVYRGHLPQLPDAGYMQEWGTPHSGVRLRKLAHTIAALARNAKRRGRHMAVAVADWEADLAYLKRMYYDGRYDFSWPRT